MTLRMATCGLMENGASKPSVPVFQTQEEEADTDEVEEKKTEEDESEDGKAEVESKDMCERHKDKITAQHSDDLRRVFIPVRYSDSCCSPLLSNKQYPLDFISFHISTPCYIYAWFREKNQETRATWISDEKIII